MSRLETQAKVEKSETLSKLAKNEFVPHETLSQFIAK
jgi:hypothetical protein